MLLWDLLGTSSHNPVPVAPSPSVHPSPDSCVTTAHPYTVGTNGFGCTPKDSSFRTPTTSGDDSILTSKPLYYFICVLHPEVWWGLIVDFSTYPSSFSSPKVSCFYVVPSCRQGLQLFTPDVIKGVVVLTRAQSCQDSCPSYISCTPSLRPTYMDASRRGCV